MTTERSRTTGLRRLGSLRAFAAAAGLIAGHRAAAQTPARASVTGVVVDSVAGKPLAGATVQLVVADATLRARTMAADSSGSFRFDSVAPGRYLLGFLDPRLDELALQPPTRVVVVRDAEVIRENFAIPGARTLAAAVCGERPDSSGLLMGRMLDAAADAPVSGELTVRWVELHVGKDGMRLDRRELRAPSDIKGNYALCGVPADVPLVVQATSSQKSSGELELIVPPFELVKRDLRVAVRGEAATARLLGRVRRDGGEPIDRAIVSVRGFTKADTTDAAGVFAFDSLPAGTYTLDVSALGFAARHVGVDLAPARQATADITLERIVSELLAVTVYGKSKSTLDLSGFTERSRGMYGRFVTAEQIERSGAPTMADVLRTLPGLRVRLDPSGFRGVILSRGEKNYTEPCSPDIYLDGMWVADGPTAIEDLVMVREVAGIEVYLDFGTAPAGYTRGPCGSILVWTKRSKE